jgi:hypothetical protein
MAFDGAGQARYIVPQLNRDRKDWMWLPSIDNHLMGVQVYNHFNMALLDFNQFSHGANHVSSVVWYTIATLIKKLQKEFPDDPSKFPKHLFLQLDNAASQNKNKTFFCFCALLVQLGIFESVTLFNYSIAFKSQFNFYFYLGLLPFQSGWSYP